MASDPGEKLLTYFDDEEHLVRRLGAAVVSCWSDVPPDLRTKLMGRAAAILDDDDDDRFSEHLSAFIAEHGSKQKILESVAKAD